MVNTSESAIKVVIQNKRKWLLRLSQNGNGDGNSLDFYLFVTHKSPGQKQAPNPTRLFERNVETPYRALRGQQIVKSVMAVRE